MITKVNSRNQVTIPKSVREKMYIKAGDRLLVDVQDGVIILIPQPESYSNYLRGLHSGIGKDVDTEKYLDGERETW